MSTSPKLLLDFDGTLVLENSSRLLMNELFSQSHSAPQLILRWLLRGKLRRLFELLLAVASRLYGCRDTQLVIVMMFFREDMTAHSNEIFDRVAGKLTLNLQLKEYFESDFEIVSTGLEPLIGRYLLLHPNLRVSGVVASMYDAKSGPQLMPIGQKVDVLKKYSSWRYITDYDYEATLIQRNYAPHCTSKAISGPGVSPLFQLDLG